MAKQKKEPLKGYTRGAQPLAPDEAPASRSTDRHAFELPPPATEVVRGGPGMPWGQFNVGPTGITDPTLRDSIDVGDGDTAVFTVGALLARATFPSGERLTDWITAVRGLVDRTVDGKDANVDGVASLCWVRGQPLLYLAPFGWILYFRERRHMAGTLDRWRLLAIAYRRCLENGVWTHGVPREAPCQAEG